MPFIESTGRTPQRRQQRNEPKRPGGWQRRIDQLESKNAALEREVEELKRFLVEVSLAPEPNRDE